MIVAVHPAAQQMLVIGVHRASLSITTDNHPGLRALPLPAAHDAESGAGLHRRRFGVRALGFLGPAARSTLNLRAVGGLLRARPAQPVPLAGP
ncbi:hypothetical protein [Streptomyces bauhiniae]|uniref:hypothetical protein n=1 Tax=Streptomyces bauhiniae TaxID=2340725 RepID=UPI003819A011